MGFPVGILPFITGCNSYGISPRFLTLSPLLSGIMPFMILALLINGSEAPYGKKDQNETNLWWEIPQTLERETLTYISILL